MAPRRMHETQSALDSRFPVLVPAAQKVTEIQHDAVLDYYGRRLATCSSDKTIKIFEVEGDSHRLTETLRG
jgi:hypothetical protein